MKSRPIAAGQAILASQNNDRRDDARGGSFLLAHQQLGALALGTAPTNGQTVSFVVNGTTITAKAVASVSSANDILNPGTALGFVTNLVFWLRRPDVTNSNQVAASSANQTLLSYVGWALPGSGTTIVPFSLNKNVNGISGALTSFNITTTVTSATWTAQTMQLYIEDGAYYVGTTRVLYSGGSTPTFTAPVSNPRIDLITADSTGTIALVTGTENASPFAPSYPANKAVLAEVYHVVGETGIFDFENQQAGQGYISNDVRPIVAPIYISSLSQIGFAFIEQSGAEISGADSGSANAYAITLSPIPASLSTGMIVEVMNIANVNTGTSTLNVNGLGAKTIRKGGSLTLSSGDLAAGMNALFCYDGTYWQMLSPTANISFLGLFACGVSTPPSSASTQNIAHGLGATPKFVRISAKGNGHGNPATEISSDGSYNGTTAAFVAAIEAGTSGSAPSTTNGTGVIVYLQNDGSPGGCQASITVTSTNLVLTWTAIGSYSHPGSFEWEAEA